MGTDFNTQNFYMAAWQQSLQRKINRLLTEDFYCKLVDFSLTTVQDPAGYVVSVRVSEIAPVNPRLLGFQIRIDELELGSSRLVELEALMLNELRLEFRKFFGENTMQKDAVKPKPKIVRHDPINPGKVKKPFCPIHKEVMDFDPVAQKFRCPTVPCNQVARPKRDSDDKILTLGEGQLQVRFVMRPGVQPQVVLVSDDNVALDITTLVPITVVHKLAQAMANLYILDDEVRVEKIVPIQARRLAGLEVTEMLLMFEPDS